MKVLCFYRKLAFGDCTMKTNGRDFNPMKTVYSFQIGIRISWSEVLRKIMKRRIKNCMF